MDSVARPIERGRLQSILKLERAKKNANLAVAGGLDRLLKSQREHYGWLLEVAPLSSGKSYGTLTPSERREWTQNVLRRLERSDSAPAPQDVLDAHCARVFTVPPNIRPRVLEALDRLELVTVRDVLYYLPREHRDLSQLQPIASVPINQPCTIAGEVRQLARVRKGAKAATQAVVSDGSARVNVVWFGNPHLAQRLAVGTKLVLSGKITTFNGTRQMRSPEYDIFPTSGKQSGRNAGGIVPLYRLREGVTQRMMRYIVYQALVHYKKSAPADFLPPEIQAAHALPSRVDALSAYHYPETLTARDKARMRLVFDEMLLQQLQVGKVRRDLSKYERGVTVSAEAFTLARQWLLARLEFQLSVGQNQALRDGVKSMSTGVPSSRLLQGEVGSGKTVVAVVHIIASALAGYSSVVLAPTEILAEQHFMNLQHILNAEPLTGYGGFVLESSCPHAPSGRLRVAILTSRLRGSKRQPVIDLVSRGEVDIAIGTHAVLQENLKLPKLGLVVIDEQHRFGVKQRAKLLQRTPRPHLLAMTATPIPRTLQITLYGNMEVSSMQGGSHTERRVTTVFVDGDGARTRAYQKLRDEVAHGRQAFIVCPFIAESDKVGGRATSAEIKSLRQTVFPDLRLAELNGKMALAERQKVINDFRAGNVDVLVTTPIVEVGVDIPNATVMLIESAERFGLSQLHQLRGRVGRSGEPSWCMVASDAGDTAAERINALVQCDDGFRLAEMDLQLRGPGDYIGTRQSGAPDMRLATSADIKLLKQTRTVADELLDSDPELRGHPLLRREIEQNAVQAHTTEIQ